ncbi:hypothetical protein Tco_0719864 [Tanacetum coccineum]
MSTSKTYQQSLADAGSETRPPMLERGSYIPWASRFRRYINRKRENRKWLNKALDEGPYQFEMFIPNNSTVLKLQTTEDLQGDALLHYDAEMELMNLILLSIPNDIYNSQLEKLVNVSRAKKLEKSHDPLALVAHTAPSVAPTTLSFRKASIDKVLVPRVQHLVPNQFGTPLVKSEEDPASLQEILQENLEEWVHPQVASPPTCLLPPLW